jgi:sodium/proline symporter
MATVATLILYFCVIFAIGLAAYRATLTHSDYVLGGRRFNAIITALGVGASDMSGWLMLGLPGAVYASGLKNVWMPIGLIVGAFLNWRWVAKRLRVFTEVADNALTIPAYFEKRFGDYSGKLRTVTALIIIVFFTIYSAAGFVAGAMLFATVFKINYLTALWISVPLIVIYTSLGGFLAVNWVDVFQGSLMLLALIILPIVTIWHLPTVSDATALWQHLPTGYWHWLSHLSTLEVISLLAWGLGYFGQPHLLVRFMAARGAREITKGGRICMVWMIISLLGAVATGAMGALYFINQPLADPETVFLTLAAHLFNPWLAGILIAAVLSCIISTIAAQLLLCSSGIAEDFYRSFFRKTASQRELMWIGRIAVLAVSMIAVLLSLDPKSRVLALVGHAWAGLGAAFGPVVLCSLFWRRMSYYGALWGMIAGALTVTLWQIGLHYYPDGIFNLYELVPGFVASFIAIGVGSLVQAPSASVVALFDKAERQSEDGTVEAMAPGIVGLAS